ncbi:2-phosphosulfolactate phosphatase [Azonexus fungiphilus]|uniref:2-phosphosulfolactate phosphatase n=1 Tax=Azonexus fungiphilus TaxID=146940 RepID=UPI00156BA843|nr:2-phosphosulfolactate phosphatase [Azonexus fungiphilus]NHC06733.1 2-phosphosulfolactate phosphatase [Azonexus fungiphilus]
MKFSRIFLNRLQNPPKNRDSVVVIDVLRSFTTAAVALDRGAAAIHAVEAVAAAAALAARLDGALSIGAVGGGDPVAGFDFGNSPASLLAADLAGRPVVLSTAAGVRGLQRFGDARRLYAASLVCARATAAAILADGADEVCFVITGEWVDRDGDEDIACADYIEALLCGRTPDPADYARRVRESDFGRRFGQPGWPNLPGADLELCADADRFDFAMPVRRRDGLLVIG